MITRRPGPPVAATASTDLLINYLETQDFEALTPQRNQLAQKR